MINALDFIRKVRIPLLEGWGYIYGQWGAVWTKEKQAAATREMTVKYGSKWIGKMVTDCSGLVRWALAQLGEEGHHHATYLYSIDCSPKGKMLNGARTDGQPLRPGSLVFLQGAEPKIHHVGVYVGNGEVIEAKGTQAGVVLSDLSRWDHWGELKMVDYTNQTEPPVYPEEPVRAVLDKNPNNYVNVRVKPSESATKLFRIEKGAVVDVLAQDGKWLQIRYGSRIGWAFGEYFTVQTPPPADPPEEPAADQLEEPADQLEEPSDQPEEPAGVLTLDVEEELSALWLDLKKLTFRVQRLVEYMFPEVDP